ncbi:MAG: hypothetical protein K9N55_08430 [Phycisphaerae bacterium]|nr:hypothetical protein [Phycisphaerae bacterium]
MNAPDFYSPSRQFRRALTRDWRLHSIELLCGILYPVIGFYVGHRVGQSQVYPVIVPFLVTAAFLFYLTRRLCLPEVKRSSVFCYFNLPQDRLMALDAHVAFLGMASLWLTVWVLAGSLLKLGGAGFTACYRWHPDFVMVPFFTTALTIRHLYLKHGMAFWRDSVLWYLLLMTWLVWRFYGIIEQPSRSVNNYWPDRSLSLTTEWATAAIMAAVAVWLVHTTRIQWRQRQIGGIR